MCLSDQCFNVKLIDFGFAIRFTDLSLNKSLGSPKYMAPETMKGKEYTEKIDIWALGLIAYELITGGCFPFSTKIKEL